MRKWKTLCLCTYTHEVSPPEGVLGRRLACLFGPCTDMASPVLGPFILGTPYTVEPVLVLGQWWRNIILPKSKQKVQAFESLDLCADEKSRTSTG